MWVLLEYLRKPVGSRFFPKRISTAAKSGLGMRPVGSGGFEGKRVGREPSRGQTAAHLGVRQRRIGRLAARPIPIAGEGGYAVVILNE